MRLFIIIPALFVLFISPKEAFVSGREESVSLEKALNGDVSVFVVEPVVSQNKTVALLRQPKTGKLTIEYSAFRITTVLAQQRSRSEIEKKELWAMPDTLFRTELPNSPDDLIWAVNSRSTLNNWLDWRASEEGVHKIPIYEELDESLRPKAIPAGQQVILIARVDLEYQAYAGIGGVGLVDYKFLPNVLRAIKADRRWEGGSDSVKRPPVEHRR
jgi:hypothetical protein